MLSFKMDHSSPLVTVVALALLCFSFTNAQLGKTPLFEDIPYRNKLSNSFWANLKPTQSHWDQWEWGWIPQSCYNEAVSNGYSPYDVEVFNVWYDDCEYQWVFCRHHNSVNSQIDMIDQFGRMPVHMREWVRHFQAYSVAGKGAYMYAADIVTQSQATPQQTLHEIGHAVDFYRSGVSGGINARSETSEYRSAVNKDTCVPRPYSNTNVVEDYTDVTALSVYEIVTPGGLDTIGANWRCLENQKNQIDAFQRSVMVPGGRCTRRWPVSTVVSMGPATGNGRRAVGKPPVNPGPMEGQPKVSKAPVEGERIVSSFAEGGWNVTESRKAIERQLKWQTEWEEKRKAAKRGVVFEA
ncbi:hypothetical protein B0O99DRAFT_730931 [Bisporella sp. PMI_857]|nr:hypothetical protein B0O99DRAFT_730931 [Bisporella sp. PMI_857]